LSVKSRAIHVPEQGENHEHQAIAKKQGNRLSPAKWQLAAEGKTAS
jgi:hypothetical protein